MNSEKNEKSWDFDNWAHRYDEVVTADSQTYYARYDEVLDAIVEIAKLSEGSKVLDIGTGTGNLARRCLDRGAKVVGLDPSTLMLARAREKVGDHPKAEFQQVDDPFLDVPYPNAIFDAVVSTYAYHHVPHRLRADSVREMVRVLKPKGRWVLGDLVFENEAAESEAYQAHRWLEEEYFSRIDDLRTAFADLDIELQTRQFTPVTWVLWAVKPPSET